MKKLGYFLFAAMLVGVPIGAILSFPIQRERLYTIEEWQAIKAKERARLTPSQMREGAFKNAAHSFLSTAELSLKNCRDITYPVRDHFSRYASDLRQEAANLPDARHDQLLALTYKQCQMLPDMFDRLDSLKKTFDRFDALNDSVKTGEYRSMFASTLESIERTIASVKETVSR